MKPTDFVVTAKYRYIADNIVVYLDNIVLGICFKLVTISLHTYHDENRSNARVVWYASSPPVAAVQ